MGSDGDPAIVDDLMIDGLIRASVADESSPIHGREPEEILKDLAPRRGPARIIDFMLRTGPYGEGFGVDPDGVSLEVLLATPHGIDFGALESRLPDVLRTPDGMIALAPELLVADVERLRDGLDGRRDHPFVLIGRRHLRSNNSWMHNVNVLVKGKPRCTLQVHPDDADALGLGAGDPGACDVPGRGGGRAGRGHRRHPARRGEHPPRLGPRPARGPHGGRRRARGREQQHPRRRGAVRPGVRQRGPQRHPRRGRARMTKLGGAIKEAAGDFARGTRAFPGSVRRAVRDPKSLTDGAAVFPIAVIFGHTFLDAFDRYGFNVILPEVKDYFDLDLEGITALASVSIVAGILLSLPVSLWSDRGGRRTWFLAGGALVAALFSITAGIATTVALFGLSRAGFGFGLIVNDPVQQSLLSDVTPVPARPSVFAGRQMMDNVGGLLGPLVFGLLAYLVSWRAPLVGVGVLAIGLGVLSLRLREPSKGCMERAAMGVTGADLDVEEEPAGFRESWRILKVIPTVRTLWFSLPFLFGGVLGMFVLIPLFLEDVYGMSAAERGTTSALVGIPGIFGLLVGIALSKRYLFSDAPWRMFQLMGWISVAITGCVLWMAVMPLLALSLVGITLLVTLFSLILPAFGTLFSIVMPPHARTVGFALDAPLGAAGSVRAPDRRVHR